MTNFKHSSLIWLVSGIAVWGIFLTACSKEDDKVEPDYSKVYKLKKVISQGQYYLTDNYEYDSTGRIERFISTTPGGNDTILYTYTDSTLVTVITSGAYCPVPDTSILFLDKRGLVITRDHIGHNSISRYSYDEAGYCILIRYFSYEADTSDITQAVTTWTFIYHDGNMIKETASYGYSKEFSYYEDKVNTFGNHNKGMPYMGKSSKNLEKIGNVTDTFDQENRLKIRNFNAAGVVEEYEYY